MDHTIGQKQKLRIHGVWNASMAFWMRTDLVWQNDLVKLIWCGEIIMEQPVQHLTHIDYDYWGR